MVSKRCSHIGSLVRVLFPFPRIRRSFVSVRSRCVLASSVRTSLRQQRRSLFLFLADAPAPRSLGGSLSHPMVLPALISGRHRVPSLSQSLGWVPHHARSAAQLGEPGRISLRQNRWQKRDGGCSLEVLLRGALFPPRPAMGGGRGEHCGAIMARVWSRLLDNFSPEGGCSEGLDAFRFFFKTVQI